jgi:hypothetical protein
VGRGAIVEREMFRFVREMASTSRLAKARGCIVTARKYVEEILNPKAKEAP